MNKELINFLKPGITAAETNSFGTRLLDEKMASIGVTREKYKKMFTYGGANHYVGLDTHDVGFYDIPIDPGMVFAVD